jgi:nicotinate phosphoribosyltransferase
MIPTIKFSDNPEKTTTPGVKQVWRIKDPQGMTVADVLALDGGEEPVKGHLHPFWHTSADYRHFYHSPETDPEPLLKLQLKNGERIAAPPNLEEIRALTKSDLETFDGSYKRILNPHIYKVSIMPELRDMKLGLIKNFLGDL